MHGYIFETNFDRLYSILLGTLLLLLLVYFYYFIIIIIIITIVKISITSTSGKYEDVSKNYRSYRKITCVFHMV